MTRFLVLMTEPGHFEKWESFTDEEQQRDLDSYRAFSAAVQARGGAVVGGQALLHPATALTRRPDGTVTDGPYAETAEQLGGFYVIEAADLATAVELAGLLPAAYTIEVRECLDVEVS